MVAHCRHHAVVQQDDAVGVLNRGDALGDDNLSGLWDVCLEGFADVRVGLGVHRRRGRGR